MSSANQEQNDGIERIGHAIVEFDENTQQNAALVQEDAAAADALAEEARHLTALVEAFKLEAGYAAESQRPAAPQRRLQIVGGGVR